MFIYFQQNKFLGNKKGQLLPLFIVIIVILLTMVMVTVNIGKVSLIKTDSSNAADAGALAAGSTMANLFNNIAVANSQMEVSFWEFFADVSVMFTLGITELIGANINAVMAQTDGIAGQGFGTDAQASGTDAEANADPDPCGAIDMATSAGASAGSAAGAMGTAVGLTTTAISFLEMFILTVHAINITIISFSIAQQFFYLSVRKMADEGWKAAVKMGHQFAFKNSGISSKLKRGLGSDIFSDPGFRWEDFSNYQETFSLFLRYIVGHQPVYLYPWLDAQERVHNVTSTVLIEPVDKFSLKVTTFPLPAELGILGSALALAYIAKASLFSTGLSYGLAGLAYSGAAIAYSLALIPLAVACPASICCEAGGPAAIVCCPAWHAASGIAEGILGGGLSLNGAGLTANAAGLGTNLTAILTMIPIYPLLGSALAGLMPGPTIISSSGGDSAMYIISWIDDVIHNRLVSTLSNQVHQGADLGLWSTDYPPTTSWSLVNFRGFGSIYRPDPRHDASIIITDLSASLFSINTCYAQEIDICVKERHLVAGLEDTLQLYLTSVKSLERNAELTIEQSRNLDRRLETLREGFFEASADLQARAESLSNEPIENEKVLAETRRQLDELKTKYQKNLEDKLDLSQLSQQFSNIHTDNKSLLNKSASEITGQYKTLKEKVTIESDKILDAANAMAAHSERIKLEAERIQEEVEKHKKEHPECFQGEAQDENS